VIEETNKPCFSVAGKEYYKKACCEVGQNVPSDKCAAVHQNPIEQISIEKTGSSALRIVIICVLASVIAVLIMGLFLSHNLKKPNPMVDVPEAVPVQPSDINMMNCSKNASMEQHLGASAPPPPFNPESSVQASVRVRN
jgi:hypothetical protein